MNLRHKEYCILNKQYSKEHYEELVIRLIEHVQTTGEWGTFFPPQLSAFGYNETVAHEYFPLQKDEATKKGFLWSDYQAPRPTVERVFHAKDIPHDIQDVTDDILDCGIICEVTGKLYRILKSELAYCHTHNIPLPKKHPDQRHTERMKLRLPRELWQRNCAKCEIAIRTPYSPERPEKVLCEKCYTDTIA
ncbi:MAG: hypothetical protein A2V81_02070 [Candidatus Abawacabacteria bacterium RBG_16_42_10]|uniref:Uncharacterized protein n=1 Tax=Candidatus Abawacabacteria bacterium RBG_16_42_10 TaxID=1817814 RepID=A0A1F4XKZ6_9BACT|nr:MAG: hypothetical protein A2V81_02070 [Candidatus Abawacabacteria bacterium RBG_16_42_10]